MYTSDEERIKALQEKRFELDCPRMELRCQKDKGEPPYQGAGYIRQTSDGALLFKLIQEKPTNISILKKSLSSVAGEIIPEKDFYALSITDADGICWKAKHIIPDVASSAATVVSGKLSELHCSVNTRDTLERAAMALIILEDLRIPLNAATRTEVARGGRVVSKGSSLDRAKFPSCGMDFEFIKKDNCLRIGIVAPDNRIPPNIQHRAIEALQFVLARPITWSVLNMHEQGIATTIIRGIQDYDPKALQSHPPILTMGKIDATGCVWKLFDKYLAYIIGCPEERWHPLSIPIHSICEAQSGYIDSQALTLSVGVEAILNSIFTAEVPPDDGLGKLIEKFKGQLSGSDISESTKKRVKGMLETMLRPRAVDVLHALEAKGAVSKEHIARWKKLRNLTAHPQIPRKVVLQEFLDLCDSVRVLFYHLVFHEIGYEGKYSDYSTCGWPIKDYPSA